MHSEHSWDCTTPIDELLDAALAAGLGALAVTDHNTIAGGARGPRACGRARPAAARHRRLGDQDRGDGEIIGLFLHEEVPRGLTFAETVERIRAQGGLVYVPHPFDHFHTTPAPRAAARARERDRRRRDGQRAPLARARQPRGRALRAASTACGAGPARTPTCRPESARARCAWRRSTIPTSFLRAVDDAEIVRRPRSMLRLQVEKRRRQRAQTSGALTPSTAGDRRDRRAAVELRRGARRRALRALPGACDQRGKRTWR